MVARTCRARPACLWEVILLGRSLAKTPFPQVVNFVQVISCNCMLFVSIVQVVLSVNTLVSSINVDYHVLAMTL